MGIRTYDFFADQSHGWLKVKRAELKELNIIDDVSGYSYQKDTFVYLEEDCDADMFIRAMKEQGITVKLREHFTDRESTIRRYTPFYIQS